MSLDSSFTLLPQANSAFTSLQGNGPHNNRKGPSLLVQALSKGSSPNNSSAYSNTRLLRGTIFPNLRANRMQERRKDGSSSSFRSYAPFEPLINERKMTNGTISPLTQQEYQVWKESQANDTAASGSEKAVQHQSKEQQPSPTESEELRVYNKQREARQQIQAHLNDAGEGNTTYKAPKAIRVNPFEPLVTDRKLKDGCITPFLNDEYNSSRDKTCQGGASSSCTSTSSDTSPEMSWKRRCQRAEIARCDARKQTLRVMDDNRQLNIQIIHQKAALLTSHQGRVNNCEKRSPEEVKNPTVAEAKSGDSMTSETLQDENGKLPAVGNGDSSALEEPAVDDSKNVTNLSSSFGGNGKLSFINTRRGRPTTEDSIMYDVSTDGSFMTGGNDELEQENSADLACGESTGPVNDPNVTTLSSPKGRRLSFSNDTNIPAKAVESNGDTAEEKGITRSVASDPCSAPVLNDAKLTCDEESPQQNDLNISAMTSESFTSAAVEDPKKQDVDSSVVASAVVDDPQEAASRSEFLNATHCSVADNAKSETQDGNEETLLEETMATDALEDRTGYECDKSAEAKDANSEAVRITRNSAQNLDLNIKAQMTSSQEEQHSKSPEKNVTEENGQSSSFFVENDGASFEALNSFDRGPLQDATNDLSSIGSQSGTDDVDDTPETVEDEFQNDQNELSGVVKPDESGESKETSEEQVDASPANNNDMDNTGLASPPVTRSSKKKRRNVATEEKLSKEDAMQSQPSMKKQVENEPLAASPAKRTKRVTRSAKQQTESSSTQKDEDQNNDPLAASLSSTANQKVTRRGRRRRGTIVDTLQAPVIKKTRRQTAR